MKPAPGAKKNPALALQLFNLREDRAEYTDVAAKHPDIVAKLTELMRAQHTPSAEFPFPVLDQR
jgi:hypothetical protein